MSAPDGLDDVLREGLIAERLRHLAALLVEREAVRQHDVEGRAAARAAAFEQGGLEPAAMLVGAFEIHHLVLAAVDVAADAGKAGEMDRVLEHDRNASSRNRTRRRAGRRSSHNRRDRSRAPRKRAAAPSANQASAPSSSKASAMRALTARRSENVVLALAHEDRDRHAPGALAEITQSGLVADHAADAVLARRGDPTRLADRVERDRAQL